MPSRTAASIAATSSGALPFEADARSRWARSAPCSCRCTRAERPRRPLARRPAACGVAGRDPGDVRAVIGVLGVEGGACFHVSRRAAGTRARRSPSRSCRPALALREAGGHRVAGRVEERVTLVDAVVDDPDLHALARGRQAPAPQSAGAPICRGRRSSCAPVAAGGTRRERRQACGAQGPALRGARRPRRRWRPRGSASARRRRGGRRASRCRTGAARRRCARLSLGAPAYASGGEVERDDYLGRSLRSCARPLTRPSPSRRARRGREHERGERGA